MKFVNLTPLALNVITPDGVITLEPSGKVARVEEVRSSTADVGGIPVGLLAFGEVEGVPAPRKNTIYVVSGFVAAEIAREGVRNDVLCPGPLVRDENGRPVGCLGLALRI